MTSLLDISENSKFSKFTLADRNKTYFIRPNTYTVQTNSQQQKDVVAVSSNTKQPINKKKHKKRNLAFAVGSSSLIVAGGVFLLAKGLPNNTQKYLEKLKKFMENKLEKSNITGADNWSEFWEYSIRKVDKFIEKSQSINNFTTLKDIGFKRLMDISKFTAGVHKKISDFFERIARRTVISSYKTSNKNFDNMYKAFDKLDTMILEKNPEEIIKYNGKEYTKSELVKLAQQRRLHIKNSINDFTSQSSLLGRYRYMKKTTASLYNNFWNKLTDNFWSKDNLFLKKEMWQTYIPDAEITGNKKTLNEQVAAVRKCISYTDKDKTQIISGYVKTLKNLILPSDKEGLGLIKKLEWFLDNPDGLSQNRENLVKVLNSIKDRPFEKGLEDSVVQNQAKLRDLNIKSIVSLIDEKNIGELQEMLDIYKKIAPYELAKTNTERTVRKAVHSFDKALKTESTEFFDKIRDLQLGSAPTDVIGIAAPMAMIGYGLIEAEDTDERKSVVYKAGIPVIGSIATTIYCTTKLLSGGISLGFAALTGLLFGVVGNNVDNYRHKVSLKNHTNS